MKCFDTLKIDKSLIDYIGDFSGERLLEHTILLAKELGLCVTAEGVEREEQVDFLKQMKCDSIQGYYYSRPLPKKSLKTFADSLMIRKQGKLLWNHRSFPCFIY